MSFAVTVLGTKPHRKTDARLHLPRLEEGSNFVFGSRKDGQWNSQSGKTMSHKRKESLFWFQEKKA